MKNVSRTLVLCALVCVGGLLLLAGCGTGSERAKQHRLIHNNDGTDALYNQWFHQRPLSKADVEAYVDMVAGTQVTTYMMCSGSDFVYYRSKYGRPFGDDRGGTLGCDDTTALRVWKQYYQNVLNLESEGTDVIAASLLRAKEHGMETFITYRMNDLHFADTTDCCPIHWSDFWMEHPEYWLGDATQGWHSAGALNFAEPAVRQRKLDMIAEQLEMYDMIDGFELDFMRFPVYFRTGEGPQNAPLITQLVKDVRAKVDSVSKARGKDILLAVRVPLTVEGAMQKGLDVKEWARLGLIDFVTIGAHWKGEPAMPVEKFREDFGYPEIPLYATIDDGGYAQRESWSHGMFRGMASRILSQGADGVYLFNYYFGLFNSTLDGQIELEPGGQVCRVMEPSLLNELGKLETLKGRNKIFCESDGQTDNYRLKQVSTLPLAVSENRTSLAELYIGDDLAETAPEEAILFVRTDRPAEFRVWVNGTEATEQRPDYPALYDRERGLKNNAKVYAFVVPVDALKQGTNRIELQSHYPKLSDNSQNFMVLRLEAALKYGPVETHGYF